MKQDILYAFILTAILRILFIFVDFNYDWPDEYWQGREIAYKIANGYGTTTWQWDISDPIRSPLYPMYLSIPYFVGKMLGLGQSGQENLVQGAQVIIAIVCDWFLLKLANNYTRKFNFILSMLILTNWFYFSMMNRTYINSLQVCCTVMAFYYWIERSKNGINDYLSRVIVLVSFLMRSTSIIPWILIWPYQLFTLKAAKIKFIIKNMLQMYISDYLVCQCLAQAYYSIVIGMEGMFVWSLISQKQNNILQQLNLAQKWAQTYGVSNFFYYFYVSIPIVLSSYVIPFIYSIFSVWRKQSSESLIKKQGQKDKLQSVFQLQRYKLLFIITIWTILFWSFSAHKQNRYIFIIVPFMLILSLKGLQIALNSKILLILLITVNFIFFCNYTLIGKKGGLQTLRQLREDIKANHQHQLQQIEVIYLCQPHSLPSYSILQYNVSLKYIDTSPPRKHQHFDEEIQLRESPLKLFEELTYNSRKNIQYVIIQEKYSIRGPLINEKYQFLLQRNYRLLGTYRNVNLYEEHFMNWDGFVLLKSQ